MKAYFLILMMLAGTLEMLAGTENAAQNFVPEKSVPAQFTQNFVPANSAVPAVPAALPAIVERSRRTPYMGWSSWNHFHVKISEDIIKAQADAMATNGMADCGYKFINIDDGFFGGRNADGTLRYCPKRFPSGMAALAKYIHERGFKAGIYSDAGTETCGCRYDNDVVSSGCGIWLHEAADLTLMLRDWDFDFIKVDWCGGERLGLDEQTQYSRIAELVYALKPDAYFNICRWKFPGAWATRIADAWRISGDIRANFASILQIIDLNAENWRYCAPGHFNDMDMLQVGRGMTLDEDKTHFSMWCMLNSPLVAGNDLPTMSAETLAILTNRELIAINQDPLCYQARRMKKSPGTPAGTEIWARPLAHVLSGKIAVALLNRNNVPAQISLDVATLGIVPANGYTARDCWEHKFLGKNENAVPAKLTFPQLEFTVPAHGIIVLVLTGTPEKFNCFQVK